MYADGMLSSEEYLEHHGIKGQKWGVRRFQNADGTLTEAGKKRLQTGRRAKRTWETHDKVDDIVNSMSKLDKFYLFPQDDHYLNLEEGSAVVKRVIKEVGGKPVSFVDIFEHDNHYDVGLGTRGGKAYRGKGYASSAVDEALDWFDKNQARLNDKPLVWDVYKDNVPSQRIAEKHGFVKTETFDEDHWYRYTRKK